MPIRNPFRKTAAGTDAVDFDVHDAALRDVKNGGVDGAKVIDIPEPKEYKLSEINDSGVYLPPSPPESKRNFWQTRSNTSTTSSTNARSLFDENEPFNMSRESFDSYRRSFDISARSPVPSEYSVPTRQSLDSRRAPPPMQAFARPGRQSIDRPGAPLEEGFEDVKLTEDGKPKKKGLFAFVGAQQAQKSSSSEADRAGGGSGHHFFTGRKRGQSGGGAELKAMDRSSDRSGPNEAGGAE